MPTRTITALKDGYLYVDKKDYVLEDKNRNQQIDKGENGLCKRTSAKKYMKSLGLDIIRPMTVKTLQDHVNQMIGATETDVLNKSQVQTLKQYGILKVTVTETEQGAATRLTFDSTVRSLSLDGETYFMSDGFPPNSTHDIMITHFDTDKVEVTVEEDPLRPRCPCTPGFIMTVTITNSDQSKNVLVVTSGLQRIEME